jgi:hypothetical protein
VLDVLTGRLGDLLGGQPLADHRLDVAGTQCLTARRLCRVRAARPADGADERVVHRQSMLRARGVDEDERILILRQAAQGQLAHRGFLLARDDCPRSCHGGRARAGMSVRASHDSFED